MNRLPFGVPALAGWGRAYRLKPGQTCQRCGLWPRCANSRSWRLPLNRPSHRQILECASPLALWLRWAWPSKAPEGWRTPRRSRVIRFTAPIRVQCWRSRLTLNLVAADVSPLHLKSVESVSRLRSAATVEGFRARILRGILTRRAASLTYPFGPPSPIQWARDDVLTGGGWVNDSTPEGEFPETVNKSKAMLKAVALAESFAREA